MTTAPNGLLNGPDDLSPRSATVTDLHMPRLTSKLNIVQLDASRRPARGFEVPGPWMEIKIVADVVFPGTVIGLLTSSSTPLSVPASRFYL